MKNSNLVVHFLAPHFAEGANTLAQEEFESVQKFICQHNIIYRYENVLYSDIWKKIDEVEHPDFLHIVAHGTEGQLLTADAYLQGLKVEARPFAQDIVNHLGKRLRYIYLGVCDSTTLGRELAGHGFTVLCFEGKVKAKEGKHFAENFYKFFWEEKKDFYSAYLAAKNNWWANGFHKTGVVPRFYCAESGEKVSFKWDEQRCKTLLERLHKDTKTPGLLERLFEELQLETHCLKPLDLSATYRYLRERKALFLLRDRAEAFFLEHAHAYVEAFKDMEEGLLKPPSPSPEVEPIHRHSVITAGHLEYGRSFGILGSKTLTKKGLEQLARKITRPLKLDLEHFKGHLLRTKPVLNVKVRREPEDSTPMAPAPFLKWMLGQPQKFFVLQGAAGSGKTTFLADVIREHFQHHTDQQVFVARFNDANALREQLKAWEEDALGNILILDALDELFDDSGVLLQLLREKESPLRAFSKVLLGFRNTFLTANQSLQKALKEEDWTMLHMAPLDMADVQNYLRERFPNNDNNRKYAAALNLVKKPDATLPEMKLKEGVTPFVLGHIQRLIEDKNSHSHVGWDLMDRLTRRILDKNSPVNSAEQLELVLLFFEDKVWQAYREGKLAHDIQFTQTELRDEQIDERILRNFSLLTRHQKGNVEFYTFSHANFKDYFLARLLFKGRIREIDFDRQQYPEAYRLYQEYCWKQIHPQGPYRYDFDPIVASALPCFAFQVMVCKHGGKLPLMHPSITGYFREVFRDWDEATWAKAKELAALRVAGENIQQDVKELCQRYIVEPMAQQLEKVLDYTPPDDFHRDFHRDFHCDFHCDFQHPLYVEVFAFLYFRDKTREQALDCLDKSPFAWLFRSERFWLEYGEQNHAFSLVYPVKDEANAYNILKEAIGIQVFEDFDREVYEALQTPELLERYYTKATQLHIQVHAPVLPAQLLSEVPFPEQFEEVSIGGDAALQGDWDMSAFRKLRVLNLAAVDISQLHIAKRPPLLETIMHPQAHRLLASDTADSEGIEQLAHYGQGHWTDAVSPTPAPPPLVRVEGGSCKIGEGWFEAFQEWKAYYNYTDTRLPEYRRLLFSSYWAELDTFYMAKYPVTVGEFARFVKATGYRTRAERMGFAFATHVYRQFRHNQEIRVYTYYLLPGLHWRHSVWGDTLLGEHAADWPVVYISYEDAEAYARWLTDTIGNGGVYRLPTEAEWEYAAKGGQQSEGYCYAGSNDVDEVAHYGIQEERRPVGDAHVSEMGKPNELGLYDMSGNVWEWCQDWFDMEYYRKCQEQEPVKNPIGPEEGSYRVIRGGSWYDHAAFCRSANRFGARPGRRNANLGFRLVFVPQFRG